MFLIILIFSHQWIQTKIEKKCLKLCLNSTVFMHFTLLSRFFCEKRSNKNANLGCSNTIRSRITYWCSCGQWWWRYAYLSGFWRLCFTTHYSTFRRCRTRHYTLFDQGLFTINDSNFYLASFTSWLCIQSFGWFWNNSTIKGRTLLCCIQRGARTKACTWNNSSDSAVHCKIYICI